MTLMQELEECGWRECLAGRGWAEDKIEYWLEEQDALRAAVQRRKRAMSVRC